MRLIMLFLLPTFFVLASACDNGGNGEATPIPSATVLDTSTFPQGSEPIQLDPADFVEEITNTYWPMKPGNHWIYAETDGDGNEFNVEVTVTSDEKTILGIKATVVHDIVTEDGQVFENTFDWYAQDVDGNIWYLGEDTEEYEDGQVVSTEGSWEAGVDGAQAGIALPGRPAVGMAYRQEYYAGQAEDRGQVLSLDEQVDVPFGSYSGVLQTADTTALEPDVLEHKYYARSVGPVQTIDVNGGGHEELTLFETTG